jgi:Uma2 family endonuclease
MRAEVTKKLFTVDEYHRMGEAGILAPDERLELIEGEIIQMSPIGQRHALCVVRATDLLTSALKRKALISPQNPLRLNKYNEPQPDIVLLKWRADYYASTFYTLKDALLVLEVSDSNLRFDTKVKLPIYAAAGIRELWIENLNEDVILVSRDAVDKKYKSQFTLRRGDMISPLAFPEAAFKVDDLLG